MVKTAIFLGGGASAAEGVPMQTNLISEYFNLVRHSPQAMESDMYREIACYFKELFELDVDNSEPDKLKFPTYEEALGILDLAVRRRETFKHFDLENISRNSNRIGFMRQYLVLLMAAVLTKAGESTNRLHNRLVESLALRNYLSDTIFITTNYDILLDNAITSLPGHYLDYGLDFAGQVKVQATNAACVKLFKVHGSLNWLYCPACNNIQLTCRETGVIRLLTAPHKSDCERCQSIMLPVIVPPTFFKEMSNVFLSIVWNKVEQSLREVERIIFCGYSFPDSDMHVKYLIKRIQSNRTDPSALKMIIVNYHPGKNVEAAENERNRYRRFLGQSVVYTKLSFEDFATAPEQLYTEH